mmetsp:Transcript_15551/g.33893  ORF Transcript_15551/g.33893 Transcript_15551/m.33893 type:complete len:277 (+) Transcript_15551:182-1012(+)
MAAVISAIIIVGISLDDQQHGLHLLLVIGKATPIQSRSRGSSSTVTIGFGLFQPFSNLLADILQILQCQSLRDELLVRGAQFLERQGGTAPIAAVQSRVGPIPMHPAGLQRGSAVRLHLRLFVMFDIAEQNGGVLTLTKRAGHHLLVVVVAMAAMMGMILPDGRRRRVIVTIKFVHFQFVAGTMVVVEHAALTVAVNVIKIIDGPVGKVDGGVLMKWTALLMVLELLFMVVLLRIVATKQGWQTVARMTAQERATGILLVLFGLQTAELVIAVAVV